MNEGVKLLLERIKTHPEEFMKGGRWVSMLSEYKEYIPDEIEPIAVEVRKLVKEEFTKKVLKELIDPDESSLVSLNELVQKAKLRHQAFIEND